MRIALIICLFLLFAASSLADLPPPLPHSVYGAVDIADGSLVEAWGEERGHRYATAYAFWYGDSVVFGLTVPGDDLTTEEVEGTTFGEIVTFFAENVGWAAEKMLWISGTSELLELHFEGGDIATPTATETASLRLVLDAPSVPAEDNDRGEWRICYRREGRIVFCVTIDAGRTIEVILRTLEQ